MDQPSLESTSKDVWMSACFGSFVVVVVQQHVTIYHCWAVTEKIVLTPFGRQCLGVAGIACWLERWTCDWKVASSNPGRSGGRIFFSRANFMCWLLFSVRSAPVLPQWHVQDPGCSVKSAGGRLHRNTHAPLTQQSQSGLIMPQSRHSVGTYWKTCSHATCHEHSVTVISARWVTVAI